jgi:hypothetical protein
MRTLTDPVKIRNREVSINRSLTRRLTMSEHQPLAACWWCATTILCTNVISRGNRQALPELASCDKAFTSVAVGIMLREKASLVPQWTG